MTKEQYLRIYEWPDKNLQTSAPAWVQDFNNPKLQEILDDMLRTCKAYRGAGLAGPQVGLQLRVVVVLDEIFINPVITGLSDSKVIESEGCLSFPGIEFPVERASFIEVSFLNRKGEPNSRKFKGLSARVMQHEIDHLDGKTFIDYLPKVKRNGFLERMRIKQRQIMSRNKQMQKLIKKAQKKEAKQQTPEPEHSFPNVSESVDMPATT